MRFYANCGIIQVRKAKKGGDKMSKSYMTLKEVAEEFDVHTDTIKRWVRAGKLKQLEYPGSKIRFSREYIESLTK